MADSDWEDNGDDGSDESLPKRLRAQLKAKDKELTAATERLVKLESAQKRATVSDLLTSAGVNPKIAKYVLADVDEPSEESIKAWLGENGELFGVTGTDDSEPGSAAGMTPAEVTAMNQLNQFVQPSQTGSSTPSTVEEMNTKIAAATTPEELSALIGYGGRTTAF